MPLDRSSDDLSTAGAASVTDALICKICKSPILNPSALSETICRHSFHKICITNYIKTHADCPVCGSKIISDPKPPTQAVSQKSSTSIRTRSSSKAKNFDANRTEETNSDSNPSASTSSSPPVLTIESVRDMVTSVVSNQQTQILESISNQITSLVEKSVEASLARLNISNVPQVATASSPVVNRNNAPIPNVYDVEQRTLEQLLGLPPANSNQINNGLVNENPNGNSINRSRISFPNSNSDLANRPDKVSQIIANWRIKFSGGSASLPVDSFIYRVEALTKQTLCGDFEILCRSASALFEGKASDWYWRFHRTVREVHWTDLCKALREQYRDSRTDIDYRELIRDRKQKPNEPFDNFYESVIDLVDRLDRPLDDKTLVEILRRNLQPDIQHEILNMTISSVSQLREICRRREFFLQDVGRRQGFSGSRNNCVPKRAAEVELKGSDDIDLLEVEEISEISLVCWNCRKPGHRYQECLAERTVFCYGCGTPQIYKPNCKICAESKNFIAPALRSARKQMIPQQSSQNA